MTQHDKLFIGEDTGKHWNNAVWVYDMDTQSLTRIATVPRGAETTGLYWHGDINGFAYLMLQVQHPANSSYGLNGTVGYLGPIATVREELPVSVPAEPSIFEAGLGSNACPDGSISISDSSSCKSASSALGLVWGSEDTWETYPRNCHRSDQSGKVYFNRHSEGKAWRHGRPLCVHLETGREVAAGVAVAMEDVAVGSASSTVQHTSLIAAFAVLAELC